MAAPMFFVWKKDGTRRPVIDYWKLNEITIKDSYPLPRINEMMDRIRGSKIFMKLDLKSGYNQIRIRPGDEWKTTFMTPFGPFRLRVMTFGFANAPPCFQQYMNKVLTPVLYKNVEVYLDDILIHHASEEEHVQGVREVLRCLQDAKLFCNLKKCQFNQPKMEFLGVDISESGFEMDEKKITAIAEWQKPTSVRGIREFIGFVNFYRRWIPGFSDVARPLHDLFQKNQAWQWMENEQTAFEILKWRVTQAPVLAHADPDKLFRMETDTSNYTYGAVLSQKQVDGRHHPVGFMSKSMNPAERNYGIPDKEALAIVKALQHWRPWLERTRFPIQILTDHKNLEYFAKARILNRRQMRWLELLTHYYYEIHYRPGDQNCAADTLSRRAELRPPEGEDEKPTFLIPPEKFMELVACEAEMTPADWEGLAEVFVAALTTSDVEVFTAALTASDADLLSEARALSAEWLDKPEGLVWEDGLGRKDGRVWIPESDELWRRVLGLYHDSPVTGHLGTSGTLELVARSYWRRNMTDWVTRYVQGCHTCRRAKHRNQRELGKLQPLPAPDGPWQWIQLDFVGELPKADGFNAIYVVSDCLTKMAHFIPMTTDISTPDLMRLHIRHVWKLHGVPLVHGTNRGSTFTAAFTKSLYKGLGIEP